MSNVITDSTMEEEILKSLENKNWLETYFSLEQKIYDDNDYDAIGDSYYPYFIYYAVNNKISQTEFNTIIKDIYSKKNDNVMNTFLSAFFNYRNTNLDIDDYFACDMEEQHISSLYYYTFLSKKNKKIIFNKEKLPYLLSILENLPPNKIKSLHDSHFPTYCSEPYLLRNLQELEPIFNIKNIGFKKEKENEYLSMKKIILKRIGNNSYNLNQKENTKMIQNLSSIIDNFEECIYNAAFNITKKIGNEYRFETDLGVLNLIKFSDLNFFEKIVEIHQLAIQKSKEEEAIYKFYINATIATSLDNFDISKISFNNMDINKSIQDNCPYLELLKMAKVKGIDLDLNIGITNYLVENLQQVKNNCEGSIKMEVFSNGEFELYNAYKDLFPYLEILQMKASLESDLDNEKTKIKKVKI